MAYIQLKSLEKLVLTVPLELFNRSETIQYLIKGLDLFDGRTYQIYLASMKMAQISKVLDWCLYHLNDPEPLFEDEVVTTPWDHEYFKMTSLEFFDIIKCAYYLGIKRLYELSLRRYLSKNRHRNREELLASLNIKE